MRRKLQIFLDDCTHFRPRGIFIFIVISGLCATAIPLGWQVGAEDFHAIGWVRPKSSIPVPPLPPAPVAPASLTSRDPLDEIFEDEPAAAEDGAADKSSEMVAQDRNALAIETHHLQQMEIELSAARRQLADTQWDLMISRGQATHATAERDRALRQVDELTRQLRENLIELSAAQKSIADLQHRSGAAKTHTQPRGHRRHPHVAQLTAKD